MAHTKTREPLFRAPGLIKSVRLWFPWGIVGVSSQKTTRYDSGAASDGSWAIYGAQNAALPCNELEKDGDRHNER
jgi:hypothetical protein